MDSMVELRNGDVSSGQARYGSHRLERKVRDGYVLDRCAEVRQLRRGDVRYGESRHGE